MSPRQVRHGLNEIEDWAGRNADALQAGDQYLLWNLLGTAYSELHLIAIRGWLKETYKT